MVVNMKLGLCFSVKSQAAFSTTILLPVDQDSQRVVTIGSVRITRTYISNDGVGLNLLIGKRVPVCIAVEMCAATNPV